MKFNYEWIIKEEDDIFYEDNVQVEQPLDKSGSVSNIDLVERSDLTLDVFDINNLILNDHHFNMKMI